MVDRLLVNTVIKDWMEGFAVVVYGPRRVGKTVILEQILRRVGGEKLVLNGDTQEGREVLGTTSEIKLSGLVAKYDVLAVDEAQRVPEIGLALKIIADKFPQKRIIVTGSSSLELAKGMKESLTGRLNKYRLFPLSTQEIVEESERHKAEFFLPQQLVFGGYPYVWNLGDPQKKKKYLKSLTEDYLFRDLFELAEVENRGTVISLAKLLAHQIGNEVSLNELGTQLAISVQTVGRYLDLLQKTFVIFEVGAYSRNLRDEVTSKKKYYFWDLGIRNALIGQWETMVSLRPDVGQLWENFLAVERLKGHEYSGNLKQYYFWRNYAGAEVDWIEEEGGQIRAFEFKWRDKKARTPKKFREAYKLTAETVNKETYLEFVMPVRA